jgi:ABC-2 type transport system permease protein
VLLAYALGIAFSLDPLVFRDTWRVLVAALAYGAIVVFSAGTLMLAISSMSRNSRYVGALWIGIWVVSGVASSVLYQAIRQEWCPLLSYTANLTRVRDALFDSESSWKKVTALFQAGKEQVSDAALARGPFARRRRGRVNFSFGPPAPPTPPPGVSVAGSAEGPANSSVASYPWQWSAAVLAGLGVLSVWILATRVRSLDRLR